MANLKPTESQPEMKLGPLILYSAPEPEIPDELEQAQVVADYLLAVSERLSPDQDVERYKRLRSGELDPFFRQFTQAEIDEQKRRLTFYDEEGHQHTMYEEEVFKRQMLPPDEQLLYWYRSARAALWGVENGEPITWTAWNQLRHRVEVTQVDSLTELLADPRAKRRSAKEQAGFLARAAVTLDSRTSLEVSSLADTLLHAMFVSDRIGLPGHISTPVQLPSAVPMWAWEAGLHAMVPQWWELKPGSDAARDIKNYPEHLQRMMSAPPYALIDRASRTGRNWKYDPEEEPFPYFEDGRTDGMRITYGPTIPTGEDIQVAAKSAVEQVNRLDDRTADVWRVILWKATEKGISNFNFYTRIRIDTREVAQALGYKKHHKGGMKPEHLLEVHDALVHLERMKIYLTPAVKGTLEHEAGQAKGKRKKQPLIKAREERVISVMAREVERDLFGQDCHMVWELALGDWATVFPHSYSPMFKALVELPSRSGAHKWAKRIGTELVLYYRQDAQGKKVKRLKWSTILDRAGLMHEVEDLRKSPNRSRATKYAEGALDALKEIGVVADWRIDPRDLARINDGMGKPGNFDVWLESVVEITAPPDVLEILNSISPAKRKS